MLGARTCTHFLAPNTLPELRMLRSRLTTVTAALLVAGPLGAQDTASRSATLPSPAPTIQIGGFLQIWYLDGHTITNAHDTYRIRRADIKLSGVISPRVRWRISLDGAKLLNLTKVTTGTGDSSVVRDVAVDERSRILQEASINVTLMPALRFDVGQLILPLSLEGTVASSQIETIERTMFIAERARGGGLGDIRDIGAAARGSLAAGYLDYQVGLYNEMGESQNNTDQNDQKATIGRVVLHVPTVPELQFGASGGIEGGPLVAQRHERAGGEAQYRNRWLTVRSEIMGARDGTARRLGYYALGAARPTPDVELVARYDSWDPDLHNESGALNVAPWSVERTMSISLQPDPWKSDHAA